MIIIRNAIKCDNCREVIESKHATDLQFCRCSEHSMFRCAVDGGREHLKRIGRGYWEDLSVTVDNYIEKKAIQKLEQSLDSPYKRIDCQEGWYSLILYCHKELKRIDPDYRPVQIKQKFGGLRYYFDTDKGPEVHELLNEVVSRYERKAAETCEETGRRGARLYKIGGFYTTIHPDIAPDSAVLVEQTPQ